MKVLYINENYLKNNTNISQNVDTNILKPSIIQAQDLYITPFLGSELDTQLKEHITNLTLTPLEEELLSLIKKSQAQFTAYMAYVDILLRWMNKSATSPTVENGQNITKADLTYVRDIAKNNAEFYLEKVREFLETNQTTFTSKTWSKSKPFKFGFDYDDPCDSKRRNGYFE